MKGAQKICPKNAGFEIRRKTETPPYLPCISNPVYYARPICTHALFDALTISHLIIIFIENANIRFKTADKDGQKGPASVAGC